MMAYQNDYVLSIIHNGKPVREFAESGSRTCAVPFGSEYKIRLKNKTNKRAKAKVTIDGMSIMTHGDGCIVLHPNQTVDLERFVDDLNSGNRFKFISLDEGTQSGEIQDPTSQDNGVIKVEFYPEDDSWKWNWYNQNNITLTSGAAYGTTLQNNAYYGILNQSGDLTLSSGQLSTSNVNSAFINSSTCSTKGTDCLNVNSFNTVLTNNASTPAQCVAEATKGATVEGSQSGQAFQYTTDFNTVGCTIITLKLRGPAPTKQVEEIQVAFETGGVLTVKINGVKFASTRDGFTISITDAGLHVYGKGVNLVTKTYRVVQG